MLGRSDVTCLHDDVTKRLDDVTISPDDVTPVQGEVTTHGLYTAPNWYQSHILAASSQYIAYGGRNMVQLLAPDTLVPLKMLTGHPKRVTSVVFVDSGGTEVLVSGCDGGAVMVWDVESGESTSTLLPSGPPITALASTEKGTVVSGDDKGFLCLWEDVRRGGVTRYQPTSEKVLTLSFSLHPTPHLAVGYRMGTINIMALSSGGQLALLHSLKGHDSDIFRVDWACRPSSYNSLPSTASPFDLLVSVSRDRSVRIWDGVADTPLRSLALPPRQGNRESALNKEQPWLAVAWVGGEVVGASPTGDMSVLLEEGEEEEGVVELQWSPRPSHQHNKKIFSLCALPSSSADSPSFLSTGMNRQLTLWRGGEVAQIAHGLGGFAYSLDISPLAPGRVAVGTGDNMVRVWWPSQNRVRQVWSGVRTKVMVVRWHPDRENLLAFGTEEGRVGVYDVNADTTRTSTTYHEKSVYALSWGYQPTKFADDPLVRGLYSCGGEGTIFCHRPKDLGKPAINVNSYIAAENKYKTAPPGRTAVDWECGSKLFAVGCSTGLIEVFRAPNLVQVAVFQYHSRIINRLRWCRNEGVRVEIGGEEEEGDQILLGSCSDDNTVCVHQISPSAAPTTNTPPLLAAHRTLTGHTARITDLAWNPHNAGQLVTGCYDGTAQVWDVELGAGVASYRGHAGRVFSVCWSQTELEGVYSGTDEFVVRSWRVGECEETSPPTVNPLAPDRRGGARNKKKKKGGTKKVVVGESESSWRTQPSEQSSAVPVPSGEPEPTPSTNIVPPEHPTPAAPTVVTVSDARKKKGSKGKSLLPLTARLDHASKADQLNQILTLARELYPNEPPPHSESQVDPLIPHIPSSGLTEPPQLPNGTTTPPLTTHDPLLTGLYSTPPLLHSLISTERTSHTSERHHHQAALLGIWAGDITTTLTTAITTRTVTETLLSAAAAVCGREVWREAVRCYVGQLKESRDPVTAATYLLLLNEVHPALDLLLAEECYREALAIARLRLPPDHPRIGEIFRSWAGRQEREMQLDSAARCYLAAGEPERAVLALCRRKDVESLAGAVEVARVTGQVELAERVEEMVTAASAAVEEE